MKSEDLIFKDLENLSYVPPLDEYKSYDEIDYGTAYHLFQQKMYDFNFWSFPTSMELKLVLQETW